MDDYQKQILAEAIRQERDELRYGGKKREALERDEPFLEANGYTLAPNGNAIAQGYVPRAPDAGAIATNRGTSGIYAQDRQNAAADLSKYVDQINAYSLPLLNEREATHGDFGKVAETAQALKRVMYDTGRLPSAPMRESIDMICSKMARIANGNASEPDHWRDIAGYATLVATRLEQEA